MLSLIKSKSISILAALVGILAVVAMYFKGRLSDEKLERAEDTILDDKAATKYANGATEAVLRGIKRENEQKDNSKRDFIDFS